MNWKLLISLFLFDFSLCLISPNTERPKSLILDISASAGFPLLTGSSSGLGSLPSASPVNPNGDNSAPGSGKSPLNPNAVFVPEMEEVRVSPVVSKRGYINICDQRTKVSQGDQKSCLESE